MIKEFERIVLSYDLPGTPFVKGDVGTIVFVYPDGKGYEVEFFALDGSTLCVEYVPSQLAKPVTGIKKVLHVNEYN